MRAGLPEVDLQAANHQYHCVSPICALCVFFACPCRPFVPALYQGIEIFRWRSPGILAHMAAQ
jgi:hypothetical protein